MRRFPLIPVVLVMVAAVIAGSAVSASADATVYVVHGIPDAVLDAALDGECVLQGAMFTDQAGPMDIPAGTHQITVSMADPANPCGGDVVLDISVELMDGENVTAVAFLDGMCNPTVAKFTNDFSPTAPGEARLILHHTACAPPIDIAVTREIDAPFEPMVQDLANGGQVVDHLRPGEWYISIAQAGSGVPAVGPTLIRLRPFTAYRAFAVGSIMHGNATVVVFEDRVK